MGWQDSFGQGLQGAAGGALAGGAFGGVGAGVGGVLGLLGGLFGGGGSDQIRQQLQDYYNRVGGMQSPQMGPAAQASASPYEQQRAGFLNQLQSWANGNGPSAALGQMRMGMDQAVANQAGMANAAGARGGGGYGAAARQAGNNQAAIQQQTNAQMGVVRSNEQMNAMNQLGLALQGAIGQNNGMSMFNAGQQNDVGRANLQAQLQTMGITTDAQLRALLGALQGAPPGMGTQILAGGASMFPYLSGMQAAGRSQGVNGPQGSPNQGNNGSQDNPFGNPFGMAPI